MNNLGIREDKRNKPNLLTQLVITNQNLEIILNFRRRTFMSVCW